jgi:hypothetical protein
MMMLSLIMAVMMVVTAVRASFRLKSRLHSCQIGSEATQHIFDYVVWSNAKNLVLNFSWEMPVSQVPCKANELPGVFVSDFDDWFRSSLNP